MGKIRSEENAAVRNAKLMAELYYYMSKEIIDELGMEKGTEVIRNAVTAYGEARVKSMKEEAAERGIEVETLEDYFKIRDMASDGWVNKMDPPSCLYCPLHDMWNNHGELGNYVGKLYCDVDFILFNSFGFNLERENCLTTDDGFCDFILNK